MLSQAGKLAGKTRLRAPEPKLMRCRAGLASCSHAATTFLKGHRLVVHILSLSISLNAYVSFTRARWPELVAFESGINVLPTFLG